MLQVRRITKDELAMTGEMFRIAFEFPDKDAADNDAILRDMEEHPNSRETVSALEKWAAFDEEGNMASMIGSVRLTARFDGHALPMGGVGGVSTLPQYRRQGGVRMCLEAHMRDCYNDGVVLDYLYPFSTRFYKQFGYETIGKVNYYSIPLRAIDADDVGGTVKPHKLGSRKADIIKVYQDYTQHYNLSVVRTEADWDRLDDSDMSKTGEYIYVWYNDAGEAKGVIGFRKVPNSVEKFDLDAIQMFWFSDSEGFRGLLQFVRGFEVYYRNLNIKLASDFPVDAFIKEWALYPLECKVSAMGMVRVLNVAKALEAAAYKGTGSVKIAVEDAILTENNKTFLVEFADRKAVMVTQTQETPDIIMPIGYFSKFLMGDPDVSSMEYFSGIKILDNRENIAKVFYRKSMLILDGF